LNKLKLLGALAGCCLVAVGWAAAVQATNEAIAQREVKIYFPGDFVHIIVEAPPDTAALGCLMPNSDRLELIHDRRSGVWHGLWQVPVGFPSGTYTAVLEAQDMQGEMFSGETVPFIIGELTMIMIAKQGAAPLRPSVWRAERPGASEPEPVRRPRVAEPEGAAAPPVTEDIRPRAKKQAGKTAWRARRPVKRKKMSFVEVFARRELSESESRLVTTTRYYMEKMEFNKVKDSLTSLVRLAPSDRHYRLMLRQVEKIIQETEKNK
jgi:hypothetical protein